MMMTRFFDVKYLVTQNTNHSEVCEILWKSKTESGSSGSLLGISVSPVYSQSEALRWFWYHINHSYYQILVSCSNLFADMDA